MQHEAQNILWARFSLLELVLVTVLQTTGAY
jgi:hypothetical protein